MFFGYSLPINDIYASVYSFDRSKDIKYVPELGSNLQLTNETRKKGNRNSISTMFFFL